MEEVILVDENDNPLGLMEKMEAHEKGLLHRAFSVFIFNEKGDFLLQQRAATKYHSPLLWSNSCCSHPRNGETVLEAANRRLMEEMGLVCDLKQQFYFIYKADLGNGLHEHELDYVFFGTTTVNPQINLLEVEDYKWMDSKSLNESMVKNPNEFTIWFKIIYDKIKKL